MNYHVCPSQCTVFVLVLGYLHVLDVLAWILAPCPLKQELVTTEYLSISLILKVVSVSCSCTVAVEVIPTDSRLLLTVFMHVYLIVSTP